MKVSNYALTWQGQRASHNLMDSMARLSNGAKNTRNAALEAKGTMANLEAPE